MKKIGIMSMQRIKNYGSFLQAYALKKMIEELGHTVEFVDYHIEEPLVKENIGIFSKILNILKGKGKLLHKLQYIKHKKEFGKKNFPKLGIPNNPNYNPKLDTLIIGSDEVFNCIQKNKNVGYSLELFGKNNKADRVITYAASFGNTTLTKIVKYKKEKELSNLLKKFNAISVRDENSRKIIKELTGTEPTCNLDPVLVFDYINKCNEIPEINIKEKYMIVYAYSGRITKTESKAIKKYCRKKDVKIYSIGGVQKYADKFIDCNPFEVLAYFKNAEFIITDTFHGSIFSIINYKPFVTLVRKSIKNNYGNEEKISYLLKKLELSKRMTTNVNEINNILDQKINYEKVKTIISREKNKAIKYINKNI